MEDDLDLVRVRAKARAAARARAAAVAPPPAGAATATLEPPPAPIPATVEDRAPAAPPPLPAPPGGLPDPTDAEVEAWVRSKAFLPGDALIPSAPGPKAEYLKGQRYKMMRERKLAADNLSPEERFVVEGGLPAILALPAKNIQESVIAASDRLLGREDTLPGTPRERAFTHGLTGELVNRAPDSKWATIPAAVVGVLGEAATDPFSYIGGAGARPALKSASEALTAGRELSVAERAALVDAIPGTTRITPKGEITIVREGRTVETTLGDLLNGPEVPRETTALQKKDIPPPAAPPIDRPLHEMTREELDHLHGVLSANEKDIEVAIFGPEKAKEYRRLQRISNSTNRAASDPVLKAADAKIDEMEAALSEVERNRLFGIGEGGPSAERVDAFRKALQGIGPEDSIDDLAKSVARTAGLDEDIARARMNEIGRILKDRGVSLDELKRHVMEQMTARFGEDAPSMWESLVRKVIPEPKAPSLTLERGATEPVSTGPSTAKGAPGSVPSPSPTPGFFGDMGDDPVAFARERRGLLKEPRGLRPLSDMGPQGLRDSPVTLRAPKRVEDVTSEIAPLLEKADTPALNKATGGFLSDLQSKVGRTKVGEFLRYGQEGLAGGEDFGEAVYQWRVDQNIRRVISESEAAKARPPVAALTPDQQGAIIEHLVRRQPLPPDLKGAADAVKPAFAYIAAGRKELVSRGLMSPEVEAQWDYFLRRIFKKPIKEALDKGERGAFINATGKPALRVPSYRKEGHLFEGNVPLSEMRDALAQMPPEMVASVKEGGPLQLVTGNDKQAMVRFTETPEGALAADFFKDAIGKAKFNKLHKLTEAEKAGGATLLHGVDYFPPLSAEQRAALDEVRDIPTLVLRTVQDIEREIAADEFFKAVAKGHADDGSPLVVPLSKGQAPAGYVAVPETMRYGAVRGQAVKAEVMQWLADRQGEVGGTMSFLNGMSDAWSQDALNSPKFGVKQWMGNAFFFDPAAGNSRFNPLNRARFNTASKELRQWADTGVMPPVVEEMVTKGRVNMVAPSKARLQIGDLVDEEIFAASADKKAHEHGMKAYRLLTGSPLEESRTLRAIGGAASGAARELSQGGGVVEATLGALEGAGQNVALGEKFGKSARSVAERIRDIAEGSDAKSRIALYLKRKEQALKAGLSEEEAIRKAGQAVNDEMQNYTRVGGISKSLTGRGGGRFAPVAKVLGPRFFTFKEVAARTIIHHATKRGWQGKAEVTAALALPYLLQRAGKEAAIATGLINRDQANKVEAQNPDAMLVPSVNQRGEPTVRATTVKGALVGPDTFDPSAKNLINDVALGGPLPGLGFRLGSLYFNGTEAKDPYTEAPIMWKKNAYGPRKDLLETPGQAATRLLQEAGGSMTPGGRTTRLLEDAATKKYRSQAGEEFDAVGVAGDILLGRSKDVTPGRVKPGEEGLLGGYFKDWNPNPRKPGDLAPVRAIRKIEEDVNVKSRPYSERKEAKARAEADAYEKWADAAQALLEKGVRASKLALDGKVRKILRERGVVK